MKHGLLLLGPVLAVLAIFQPALQLPRLDHERTLRWWTTMALSMVAVYVWYVARVGGDFMYARFLIPITPLLAVLVELGVSWLWPRHVMTRTAVLSAVAAGSLLLSRPVGGEGPTWVRGIADEWAFYRTQAGYEMGRAEAFAPILERVPVTVILIGADARIAYRHPNVRFVEGMTGLTDPVVARQELEGPRGRPGHEKTVPLDYLASRPVHLTLSQLGLNALDLEGCLPRSPVRIGSAQGWLLVWDGRVVEQLRAAGAEIPDYPAALDRALETAADRPPNALVAEYAAARRFYLEPARDTMRDARFRGILEEMVPAGMTLDEWVSAEDPCRRG